MIFRPTVGQRVVLHYRRGAPRGFFKFHGLAGTVTVVARGPGPINVEVLLDPPEAGFRVCVPRGNLMHERK